MDPVSGMLIGKALDFLFDEVKLILAQRRTRQAQAEKSPSQTKGTDLATTTQHQDPQTIPPTTREEILRWNLSELAYQQREREIQSLVSQLTTHRQNLNHAYEQAAKWGDALVPSIIVNTINDEEQKIFEKSSRLKRVLEQVYGRSINIEIPAPDMGSG